jgi:hypothetical protein
VLRAELADGEASSTTPAAQLVRTQATKSSNRSVPRARSERARSACL